MPITFPVTYRLSFEFTSSTKLTLSVSSSSDLLSIEILSISYSSSSRRFLGVEDL
jgi:hypothetical protein